MLKQYKWKLILTSLVILLPMLAGLLLWDRLPELMAVHWGPGGTADGYSGKLFAVLFLPLFLLGMQWLLAILSIVSWKKRSQNPKVVNMVLWIMPITSLVSNGGMYSAALGWEPGMQVLLPLVIGLMFVLIGNYMPKCRQNHIVGVRIRWTLENEENWNATHRVTGRVWVIGGLLVLLAALLPMKAMLAVVLIALVPMTAVPVIYSYCYHRRQIKVGTTDGVPLEKTRRNKPAVWLSVLFSIVILGFAAVMMFTGEITYAWGETSFTVDASFWTPLTVEYAAIEDVQLLETPVSGVRTFGLGSGRLLAGQFRSESLGNYTRYTYTRGDLAVLVKAEGKTLVISGRNAEETKAIYERLLEK